MRDGQFPLMVDPSTDDFGCILTCAVRYAIGRETYMPKLVMDYIRPMIQRISNKSLWNLIRSVKEGAEFPGYGNPNIDAPEWEKFLHELRMEKRRREVEGLWQSI